MDLAAKIIGLIYYCLVGFVSFLLLWSLIRTRSWEREILYIIVLLPFLLRLFHLK